jgi:hypothetical protein
MLLRIAYCLLRGLWHIRITPFHAANVPQFPTPISRGSSFRTEQYHLY